LGWAEVPVCEEGGSELDARLWEIAENLPATVRVCRPHLPTVGVRCSGALAD